MQCVPHLWVSKRALFLGGSETYTFLPNEHLFQGTHVYVTMEVLGNCCSYLVDHPLTKMYVKGGRGRGCNIHCTRVRFYYWGISSIQFSEGGGHFFEC